MPTTDPQSADAGSSEPTLGGPIPERADELERDALLRVAAAAAGASGLEDVLELACEEARDAVGAASLSVSRWRPETRGIETLINVGCLGPGEVRFPSGESYAVEDFPELGEMIRLGRPYFNVVGDRNCDPATERLLKELHKSSDVGVAITVEGEFWGEIWATKETGEPPFRADDVEFLEAIAGQFAIAITRAELFSRVSRLAYEDSLTGLANRRALEERLERATRRAAAGTPLAVVLCDLDGLKAINDAQGHAAGDEALRRVAKTLIAASANRPGAFVARLAGDEFCVLLEGQRLDDAVAVGQAAVEALTSTTEPESSISCGAAAIASGISQSPSDFLRSADTALYVAKGRGGGTVCSTSEAGSERLMRRTRQASRSPSEDSLTSVIEALVGELDGRLADAPVLDRLEAVATTFTQAGNFATWSVSVVAEGADVLVDLSLGDNRVRQFNGVRTSRGVDEYPVDEYPATAALVAAGTGSFVARADDPDGDEAEQRVLAGLGFDSVVGAVAANEGRVYLVELYGDARTNLIDATALPLRLALSAAMPLRNAGREDRRSRARRRRAAALMLRVPRRLNEARLPETAARVVCEELQHEYGCLIAQVVRIQGEWLELVTESGVVHTRPGWPQELESGLIGRCIRDREPVLIPDVRREPQFRGAEQSQAVRSELSVPVYVGDRIWGAINIEDSPINAFSDEEVELLTSIAVQLSGALRAIELEGVLERSRLQTLSALATILDATEPETAAHARSVAKRAVAVGTRLGMAGEEIRLLSYAAVFHDIGKLAIPDHLLAEPGPVTPDEMSLVEGHPGFGERFLAPIEFLRNALPMVRHAHERWDGEGYPDGLAGEQIPLGARIVFVCDAYDAMTHDRIYRQAMPPPMAREELLSCAGSQIDPMVVDALLAVIEDEEPSTGT